MPGWLLQLLSCPGHQQCAAWWPGWPPPHGAAPGGTPHHAPPPALPGLKHMQTAPVPRPPAQCHYPNLSSSCINYNNQTNALIAEGGSCRAVGTWLAHSRDGPCNGLAICNCKLVKITTALNDTLQGHRGQDLGTTRANHIPGFTGYNQEHNKKPSFDSDRAVLMGMCDCAMQDDGSRCRGRAWVQEVTWRAWVRGTTAGRAAVLWAGWEPRARWRSVLAVLYCTPSSPAAHQPQCEGL